MASKCSMSRLSIIVIHMEASGKNPFLATADDTLNILMKSYPIAGAGQQSNILVLIHNAFQPLSYWNGFMSKGTQYTGVAMDTHIYQMFDDEVWPPTHSTSIRSQTPHRRRLYRSTKQGIFSLHAETRQPCPISTIISY